MACDLASGITGVCKNYIGGLKNAYLFNFVDSPFTVSNGEATAINVLVTAVYQYEIDGDVHGLTEEFTSDRNTGTSVNTQTTTLVLKQINATKSAELNNLVYGKTVAVLEDRNGNFVAVGIDDGIDFSISSTTGLAKTDLNGYTLTGTSTTNALAPVLDSTTVDALLALVA